MAPHSSLLVWKIPWTREPGGLQPIGSQRVSYDLALVEEGGRQVFFGGGWERRGAAVLSLFWTRHNLACWAAPVEAMVHLSLTPSAFFAGARHGLGGGAGKEGQHGRGAHRPGMPGPHHPPPPPAPQETCSPPNRPQDPGPRGVGDSTGPRASLCPTSRGRELVAAFTYCWESPSPPRPWLRGHRVLQHSGLRLSYSSLLQGDGDMSPEPEGQAGEMSSAWPMCHLLGSLQQRVVCCFFFFFCLFQLYLNIIDIQ